MACQKFPIKNHPYIIIIIIISAFKKLFPRVISHEQNFGVEKQVKKDYDAKPRYYTSTIHRTNKLSTCLNHSLTFITKSFKVVCLNSKYESVTRPPDL